MITDTDQQQCASARWRCAERTALPHADLRASNKSCPLIWGRLAVHFNLNERYFLLSNNPFYRNRVPLAEARLLWSLKAIWVANKINIYFCSTVIIEILKQKNHSISSFMPAAQILLSQWGSLKNPLSWEFTSCSEIASSTAKAMKAAFDLKIFLALTILPTHPLFLRKWRKINSASTSLPFSSVWERHQFDTHTAWQLSWRTPVISG